MMKITVELGGMAAVFAAMFFAPCPFGVEASTPRCTAYNGQDLRASFAPAARAFSISSGSFSSGRPVALGWASLAIVSIS